MNTKKRVLIVEDEAITALIIYKRLSAMGYDIQGVVSTGEEAVRIAEMQKPDIIFMDILLAGEMDGIEATQQILSKCNVPVVFMTAYSTDEMRLKVEACKPLAYLEKPINFRLMEKLIGTLA